MTFRVHVILLLPLMLSCSPQSGAVASVEHAGPKGLAEVPSHFHGLWVSDRAICGHGGDRGQRILVGADHIDHMSVTFAQTNVDEDAVLVHLKDDAQGAWHLTLNLVRARQRLKVSSEGRGFDVELLRCPAPEFSAHPRTGAATSAEGQY